MSITGVLCPDGHIIRRSVQQVAGRLFMVTIYEKNGSAATDQPQVGALERVPFDHLRGSHGGRIKRINTEIITHGQIKIRLIGGGSQEGASVKIPVELGIDPFRMGITLDAEGEAISR